MNYRYVPVLEYQSINHFEFHSINRFEFHLISFPFVKIMKTKGKLMTVVC
jgi:hypothetical protein